MSRNRREKQQLKAPLATEPPIMRLWRDLGKVGWVIGIFLVTGGTVGDSPWILLAGWIAAPSFAWLFPIRPEHKKQFLGWTVLAILMLLLIQAIPQPPFCGVGYFHPRIHPYHP